MCIIEGVDRSLYLMASSSSLSISLYFCHLFIVLHLVSTLFTVLDLNPKSWVLLFLIFFPRLEQCFKKLYIIQVQEKDSFLHLFPAEYFSSNLA